MNYARAAYNWGQVAARAVVYGGVAFTAGAATRHRPLLHWCMRRWCKGSADGLKISREIIGAENLDVVPQAIIVANHLSSLDVLVIGGFLHREFRWLAKSELFSVPISGWYLSLAGHIRVHRGESARERNRLIKEQVARVVGEGASVLFFPEGTRSRDGRLKPFQLGAFLAAVRNELPVIPLVVRGTGELLEAGAKDLSVKPDRHCSVTVLPPVPVTAAGAGDDAERATRLRDHVWHLFAAELGPELTGEGPAPTGATDAPAAADAPAAEG